MSKPQYAILRFAKYKGPEIGNIEAHNERTKEKYASNPDVDISRSKIISILSSRNENIVWRQSGKSKKPVAVPGQIVFESWKPW